MDTISIIIPVYNVENYLVQCIDSGLAQSYPSIEIILVDDGSTDNSGKICDHYAGENKNVVVIHKTNGGLSDARNVGIRKATGEYIMFVDGDDVVDSRLAEYLYNLITKNNAQIGICDLKHCYINKECRFEPETSVKVLESKAAIIEMLYQKSFLVSACGKIFPSRFFGDIEFPVGFLFEDSAIMYKLFEKAERIAYGNAKLYGYCHRENSITTKAFTKKDCDILIICNQIDNHYIDAEESLIKASRSYHVAAALRVILNVPENAGLDDEIEACKGYLKLKARMVMHDKYIRRKMRLALLLYLYAKPIMHVVYRKVDRWK